jgi:hypothetical protein
MVRLEKADYRIGVEVNVGVDKQKVGRLRALLVEARDGQVSGPVDERLVLGRIEHHLDAIRGASTLETKHGLGIGLETNAAVTRRAYEEYNRCRHYKIVSRVP